MTFIGSFGAIALAAYKPDRELFSRQLTSIKAQTHADFECVISADGGTAEVAAMVEQIVGDDERFRVVGFDERLGFYLNFERALVAVSPRARWIALSDQDDLWYPEKLEHLLPELDSAALVSGQARVVRYPSGEEVSASTERIDVRPEEFTLTNQFTGGQCVFRASVLDVALPFPRVQDAPEVHDHWIALCAAFSGGTRVVDEIVQDYVQHEANAIGEQSVGSAFFSLRSSWSSLLDLARRHAGGTSPSSLLRVSYGVSVGWREGMVDTLWPRIENGRAVCNRLILLYGSERRFWRTFAFIRRAAARGTVNPRSVIEYVIGWTAGWIARPRREPLD